MVSSSPRPHFTPGKDPVHILQEAGWAPGPVWTGGKSRPHRDSILDRPAPRHSLHRLIYPAHTTHTHTHIYIYFLLAPSCPLFEQSRVSRLFETSATTHRTAQRHVPEDAVLSSTRGGDYPSMFAGLLAAKCIMVQASWFPSVFTHGPQHSKLIMPASHSTVAISMHCSLSPFLQTPPIYFPSLCLSLLNSQSTPCRHYLNP